MSAEEKARAFLDYIGSHERQLRRNLAKNITYDREVFENAFQDTVVRVYETVLKNGSDIKDYEKYFFMASRKRYLTLMEQKRRQTSRDIPLQGSEAYAILDEEYQEAEDGPEQNLNRVVADVKAEFGEAKGEMFIGYFKEKIKGRMNYRRYGESRGIPSRRLKDVISEIKKHVRLRHGGAPSAPGEEDAEAERIEKDAVARIRRQYGIHREEKEDMA